jgi:hypothetical protein
MWWRPTATRCNLRLFDLIRLGLGLASGGFKIEKLAGFCDWEIDLNVEDENQDGVRWKLVLLLAAQLLLPFKKWVVLFIFFIIIIILWLEQLEFSWLQGFRSDFFFLVHINITQVWEKKVKIPFKNTRNGKFSYARYPSGPCLFTLDRQGFRIVLEARRIRKKTYLYLVKVERMS